MIDFAAPSPAPGPTGPQGADAAIAAQLARGRARQRELARLGDEIARLSAHIGAATYRLLVLIREFDAGEGWHEEGFRSCAAWLSWRTGLAPGAAREKVRVARALGSLPALSEALHAGRLSYSAARALTRVATPENEAELVETARQVTAGQLERLVRGCVAADRAEDLEREGERHAGRELWVLPEADGSWVVRGRLDPEAGALLRAALEAAGEALYGRSATGPESSPQARRADALGLVAEAALGRGLRARAGAGPAGGDAQATGPGPGPGSDPVVGRAERFLVVVHVSAETLAGAGAEEPSGEPPRIDGGPHVSAETSRRLACDAGVVAMREDRSGTVLDVGRRRRTVPPALRRALVRRDGGCRFPGCTARRLPTTRWRWLRGAGGREERGTLPAPGSFVCLTDGDRREAGRPPRNRRRTTVPKRRTLLLAAAAVLATAAWYAFRPERLFLDRVVAEEFPGGVADPSTSAGVAGAAPGEAETPPEVRAAAADRTPDAPRPAAEPEALLAGAFRSDAHETVGDATIYRLDDGRRILRLTNFETSNGPDVRVYLVAAGDVRDAKAVKAAAFVDLGEMKGNVGDQNYEIPDAVDLDEYRAVSIWCRRFSVNFGAAALAPVEK